MDTRRFACLVLGPLSLVLSEETTAQTGGVFVVPPALRGVEGTGSTNVPFGRSQPVRVQLGYDWSLIPRSAMLREVRFRPDRSFRSAGKRISLHLHLGTISGRATDLAATFSNNVGADYTDVLGCQEIDFPGSKSFAKGEEFPIAVPFSRGFAYNPARGSLLLDLKVRRQPKGAYRLDSTYTCVSPMVAYGPSGCGPAGGQPLKLESMTKNIVWGNQLVLRVSQAPADALTILFFGNQGSGGWRGITLPWDAGPLGAPGCHLSTSILYAPRRGADALGRADYGWNVPPLLRLQQTSVTVQAIANDRLANSLGIVTSRAARLKFCGFEPVARVFAGGSRPLVGVRELGVAPVIRLGF